MKTSFKIIVGLVLILLGARLALPFYVKKYVNNLLMEIPGYQGHVNDIDINLFRGAYVIDDLEITKTENDIAVPFIRVHSIDLSVQWKALLDGRVVGEMHFESPELNFVGAENDAQTQYGSDTDWTEPIKKLFPIEINRLTVENGEVHYRNFSTKPQVDLYLHKLELEVTNLRNTDDSNERLPSEIKLSGVSIGGGQVNVDGRINILKKTPDTDIDMSLEKVDFPALNDYLKAFAGIDAEQGTFDVYCELVVNDGKVTGYVKPIIRDMTIVTWQKDNDEPLELLWESIAGFVLEIFENQEKDQFATQVPFDGNLDNPDMEVVASIWNILSNAFVEAFARSTNNEISFDKTESSNREPEPDN